LKKKKLEKKRRSTVRPKNWEQAHEFSFTHDRVRHRRAQVSLPERPPEAATYRDDFEPNGTVMAHSKKWAFVEVDGAEAVCIIDEGLRESGATLLAPGDRVLVAWEEGQAIVRAIAPRRSRLSRPASEHGRVPEQVLAANVDVLLVVAAAAQPPFRPGLVDRYLIASQVGGVPPVLCINKIDLVDAPPPEVDLYRELGIEVFLTSCESGAGLDALRARLANTTTVLSGHSGVGKSSLLNALDPGLEVLTQSVSSATDKGRHTTSAARLYRLRDDIRIIDTPGIRALGLWGVSPEELAYYFPEIADRAAGCRFRDCTHTHEPHCAVLAAIESGEIPPARVASYLRIRASLESDRNITPGRMSPRLDP
jgi:ribosome biogenesis GTPase